LERLDGGGVVVALDLEGDGLALAEVDDTGVLAGTLEDARRVGREALQEQRRVLVAAVLRPEEREDGELEVVRLPLEQLLDTVEFPVGQAEGAVERLFCNPRQMIESSEVTGWVVAALFKVQPTSSPRRSYSGKAHVSVPVVRRICDPEADR
jgi:hypothetical protein